AQLLVPAVGHAAECFSGTRDRITGDERRAEVVQCLRRLVAGGDGIAKERGRLRELSMLVRGDALLHAGQAQAPVEREKEQDGGRRRGLRGGRTLATTAA